MKNILSIDLESWTHFSEDALRIQQLPVNSSKRKFFDNNYIPDATKYILDLLDKYNQKATFFIIAELYNWYPDTIDEIEKKGHEIGYHTHTHKMLYNKEILEGELKQSSKFLRKFNPAVFRAPQIYITRDSMECLRRYGFKYSSSTYSEYKIINFDGIDEIPVSCFCFRGCDDDNQQLPKPLTLKMLSRQIPFGSGLFISLLGSKISYFIDSLNKKHIPAILFLHPWQLYRHRKIKGAFFKLKVMFRNPLCLPYTMSIQKTMEKLFERHSFVSFREYYEQ